MKVIPQRELRNNVSRVLREVEQGERMRITVDGRPVADLIPIEEQRSILVPRSRMERILESASLDADFAEILELTRSEDIESLRADGA